MSLLDKLLGTESESEDNERCCDMQIEEVESED